MDVRTPMDMGAAQPDTGETTPVPRLHHERVDGVRTITPAVALEGDVTAALTFRVGAADEPVTMRGVSHLVEHLSLTTFESERLRWNGTVDLSRTTFYAHGPAPEVGRFFREVCANLSELPRGRVAHERRVLQIEAQSRQPSIFEALLTMRYGLQGPGRVVAPEWGLEWLDHEHASEWARRWFTTGNVVLWSSAPLPDLRLELPAGEARPPTLPDRSVTVPAVQGRDAQLVALSSEVERRTATAAAARHLDRALRRQLRGEHGLTYSAGAGYGPLTPDRALVTVGMDVHADHGTGAVARFIAVLDRLARDGVTEADLTEDKRAMREGWTVERAELGWMDRVAFGTLIGEEDPEDVSFLAELEQMTSADVAAGVREIRDQAILIVPKGSEGATGTRFTSYSRETTPPVSGDAVRWRYVPPGDGFRVVYGDDGVTHWDEHGEPTTVPWDRCAGVIGWKDGTRLLYGLDGTMLQLDANEWRRYDRLRAHVDDRAPRPVAQVDRGPERDPEWARRAKRWAARRWLVRVGPLMFLAAAILPAVAASALDGSEAAGETVSGVLTFLAVVGLWVGAFKLFGRWRRRR